MALYYANRQARSHRLRRLGVTKNFTGGEVIVTGHRIQLTIAITDSAAITMKIGVAVSEACRKTLVYTPNCDILRYISRKSSQKIFK